MNAINKSSGYFNSFDGTRIYYEVRGEGKPLVFAYGIACLINHWRYQLDYFSKSYQTIILDYRGHHYSGLPEDKANLSVDAIAQDINLLCDHLGIEKAVFLGHSFGNEILLEAYLKRPDLFVGCCFISAFFSNPFSSLVKQETFKELFVYVKKAYNKAPNIVSALWKNGVNHPLSIWLSSLVGGFNLEETSVNDIEIYAQGVANIDVRVFITLFEQLTQHDNVEELKQLKVPTLLVSGERDSLTPAIIQHQIKNHIPDCELHMMNNGSHCVQLDFPESVNLLIENYLKKINY